MNKIFNKKASFDYFLLDHFEAGLQLIGDEIKAVRSNRVALTGSYGRLLERKGKLEAYLVGAHFHTDNEAQDPQRTRKLLLNRDEIDKIFSAINEKGLTLVPVSIYISHGLAKLEVALARGKKKFDKRETIKKRDIERKISSTLKSS